MNSVLDLFMGDPVYDEQKNIIRRDFGVKNIVAIMVVGFAGYSLMGEMKPISGKRKMKGGVVEGPSVWTSAQMHSMKPLRGSRRPGYFGWAKGGGIFFVFFLLLVFALIRLANSPLILR